MLRKRMSRMSWKRIKRRIARVDMEVGSDGVTDRGPDSKGAGARLQRPPQTTDRRREQRRFRSFREMKRLWRGTGWLSISF